MDARETLIAWTPRDMTIWETAGRLLLTDSDPRGSRSGDYMKSTGGQNTADWRDASDEDLGLRLLRLALQMIVEHGLDPEMVYDSLAEIDQFVTAAHPYLEEGDRPEWLSDAARERWDREGR